MQGRFLVISPWPHKLAVGLLGAALSPEIARPLHPAVIMPLGCLAGRDNLATLGNDRGFQGSLVKARGSDNAPLSYSHRRHSAVGFWHLNAAA